jgi:hypothetical protein
VGKPKPPAAPDYIGAAKEQGIQNVEAARTTGRLSNPNMITPYGNQTVTYEGDIPTVTQTLTPTGMETVGQQQQTELGMASTANEQMQKLRELLNTPFSFGGTPQTSLDESGIAQMPVNAGTTGQEAIMKRLAPALAQMRTQRETELANQGLGLGGEAYGAAQKALGEQENDALSEAARYGIDLDMAANNQGFGQALSRGNFGNQAMQQALAMALTQRQIPINEIAALMSGSQVQNPQFPGFQGSTSAPAPTFAGTQAKGQYDQDIYAQQVAQRNALLGGLTGLAAAPFSMFNFKKG